MFNFEIENEISVFYAADHEFIVPTKGIKNPNDMIVWQKSEAYFVRIITSTLYN